MYFVVFTGNYRFLNEFQELNCSVAKVRFVFHRKIFIFD